MALRNQEVPTRVLSSFLLTFEFAGFVKLQSSFPVLLQASQSSLSCLAANNCNRRRVRQPRIHGAALQQTWLVPTTSLQHLWLLIIS